MKSYLKLVVLAVGLNAWPALSLASWSCECWSDEAGLLLIDGETREEAERICREEVGSEPQNCQSQGRGDRSPLFLVESVRVPVNPGGVDVCRNFIAYHKKINELEITLNGRTPENMKFMHNGKVVGTMIYNDDGSEAAICTAL